MARNMNKQKTYLSGRRLAEGPLELKTMRKSGSRLLPSSLSGPCLKEAPITETTRNHIFLASGSAKGPCKPEYGRIPEHTAEGKSTNSKKNNNNMHEPTIQITAEGGLSLKCLRSIHPEFYNLQKYPSTSQEKMKTFQMKKNCKEFDA